MIYSGQQCAQAGMTDVVKLFDTPQLSGMLRFE